MKSMKSGCLAKMIFFGEKSLRIALIQYPVHYHTERNHRGWAKAIVEAGEEVGSATGNVFYHDRLGGLLHYYHRSAA